MGKVYRNYPEMVWCMALVTNDLVNWDFVRLVYMENTNGHHLN